MEEKIATIKTLFFGALDYVLKNTWVHFRAVAGSAARLQRRSGKFAADLLDVELIETVTYDDCWLRQDEPVFDFYETQGRQWVHFFQKN